MPRKDAFEVTVAKPGYSEHKQTIQSGLSKAGAAGLVGNVAVGGVIGVVVDSETGSTHDLKPNPLNVTLIPLGVVPTQGAAQGIAPAKIGAEAVMSDADAQAYKLGPGDKLNIITFDEAQLTGVFAVNSKGAISLPWIGDVAAVGRTETQVRDDIVARLRDGYIINPQVSVQILALRPYYILGEVNKPGQYPYVTGLTVMAAVATAQGFTYRANQHKVYIKHVGQAGELRVPLSAGTEVQVGDTIRIVERYF
jgi:polysaccharide export outer membrane protein